MNSKIIELMKNRKFLFILGGVIIFIGGLILIFRKSGKSEEKPAQDEGKNNLISEQRKTIKELQKKNKQLEEKARGKNIGSSNTRKPIESVESGKEGQGETARVDEESITSDDSDESAVSE